MNEKLIIKNGGIKRIDIIYLSISIGMFVLGIFDQSILGFIVGFGLFSFFVYNLIDRYRDKNVKVELSESGIKFANEKMNIPWTSIGELEIKRGDSDFMEILTDYLFITKTRNGEIVDVLKFDIDDYYIDKKKIVDFANQRIKNTE